MRRLDGVAVDGNDSQSVSDHAPGELYLAGADAPGGRGVSRGGWFRRGAEGPR